MITLQGILISHMNALNCHFYVWSLALIHTWFCCYWWFKIVRSAFSCFLTKRCVSIFFQINKNGDQVSGLVNLSKRVIEMNITRNTGISINTCGTYVCGGCGPWGVVSTISIEIWHSRFYCHIWLIFWRPHHNLWGCVVSTISIEIWHSRFEIILFLCHCRFV